MPLQIMKTKHPTHYEDDDFELNDVSAIAGHLSQYGL